MLFWQICLSVKQTQSSPFSSVLASTSAKYMFTNFIAKQQLPAAPADEVKESKARGKPKH